MSNSFSAAPICALPGAPARIVTGPAADLGALAGLVITTGLMCGSNGNSCGPTRVYRCENLACLNRRTIGGRVINNFTHCFGGAAARDNSICGSVRTSSVTFGAIIPNSPRSSKIGGCRIMTALTDAMNSLCIGGKRA